MKETDKLLIERVRKAKVFLTNLDTLKHPRQDFIDSCYGSMYKAEADKIDNLWYCKTADSIFTDRIENFALNPTRYLGKSAEFIRFMKFVNWYMQTGGRPLTETQIEKVYPKFQYKNLSNDD